MMWYRRIRGVQLYTPFWYLFGLPLDCFYLIILLLKKRDLKRYWVVKRRINLVRKQCKSLRVSQKVYTTNTIMGVRLTPTKQIETVKIYYKYTDSAILFKFRMHSMSVQIRDYEKFVESCHVLTGLKNTDYEINSKNGYAYFKIFEEPTPLHEVSIDVQNHEIAIGTGFEGLKMWAFDKYPHCLVIGETSSGKSTFMAYLLSNLLQFEVWVLDGKIVDYASSKSMFTRYLANKNATANLDYVRAFHDEMLKRYELMEEHGVKKYSDIGLKPVFLVMDEYADIVEKFGNSKESKYLKEEMKSLVGSIARLGRASGTQIIVIIQRPDTTYIDGNARDQFQLRIVLGSASEQAYVMAFENRDMQPLRVGKAWYRMGISLDVIAIPEYTEIEYIGD